jgi:hypothetical protein
MDQKEPSLDATRRVSESIREYLGEFRERGDSLFIGPIEVGTPENPRIVVPIDMNLNEIQHHLERTRDMLSEAIRCARESAHLTRKVIEKYDTDSPEAEHRIRFIEEIANGLEAILDSYRGIAWYPKCYIEIKEIYEDRFVAGNPAIRILVELWI